MVGHARVRFFCRVSSGYRLATHILTLGKQLCVRLLHCSAFRRYLRGSAIYSFTFAPKRLTTRSSERRGNVLFCLVFSPSVAELGGVRPSDMNYDYVQYGCGWSAPEGWLNFDASPTLRFERFPLVGKFYTRNAHRFPPAVQQGDIVRGLPISGSSCTGVYCSHVLEHLALDDFRVALRHTFEYLKPGGVFRLVLPDLEQLAREYLADGAEMAAHRFMESSYLGTKQRARGLKGLVTGWLGNSSHLWMWDEKAMTAELRQQGFIHIRKAAFGDAEDRRFDEVEEKGRFDGCLAMQCQKPA